MCLLAVALIVFPFLCVLLCDVHTKIKINIRKKSRTHFDPWPDSCCRFRPECRVCTHTRKRVHPFRPHRTQNRHSRSRAGRKGRPAAMPHDAGCLCGQPERLSNPSPSRTRNLKSLEPINRSVNRSMYGEQAFIL